MGAPNKTWCRAVRAARTDPGAAPPPLTATFLRRNRPDRPISSSRVMRCEDCGRRRLDGEPGWVAVDVPRKVDLGRMLFYCPEHARQWDPFDPNVMPIDFADPA